MKNNNQPLITGKQNRVLNMARKITAKVKKLAQTLRDTTFVLFFGLLLSQPAWAAERVTYLHTDALGSIIAASDASGNVLWREHYRPFGERIANAGGGTHNIWYTGKEHDDDIGLSYFGARWYDPTIGRFMAIDPVGFQGGNIHSFNRYAYANNNPYLYVDPDGEFTVMELFLAVGITALTVFAVTEKTRQDVCRNTGKMCGPIINPNYNNESVKDDGDSETDTATTDSSEEKEYNKHGGGKNAKHSNPDKRKAAEEKWKQAKADLDEAKRNGASKKEKNKLIKQREHWKKKMDNTGENHSQNAKGNQQ